MGRLRAFFGLGWSKVEKIEFLKDRLRSESNMLDRMVFAHPETYRHMQPEGSYGFRPGVARLEMRAAFKERSHD